MNNRKLGSLFLISILALAGIGMSYAGFSDTITITGTASIGTVDIEVIGITGTWVWKDIENHLMIVHTDAAQEDGTDPQGFYGDSSYELVSFVTATTDAEDDDVVTVIWENLFPLEHFGSYYLQICMQYKGTIPARIVDIEADYTGDWIEDLEDAGYLHYALYYPPVTRSMVPEIPVEICDQLHTDDIFCLYVDVDIIQDNAYQGMEGSASFSLDVIQWNEADCDEPLDPKPLVLPEALTIDIQHYGEYPSYWWVTFTGVPTGDWSYPIAPGGTTQGWCVDEYTQTTQGSQYVTLLSSLDPSIQTVWPGHPDHSPTSNAWDCVNYIINHDNGYDRDDVQAAIWYFVNGGNYPSDSDAIALVVDAIDNVVAWLADSDFPQPGHWVAVYCEQPDNEQNIIIEVDP